MPTEQLRVAVLMERTQHPNAWEDWRHAVVDVVVDEGAFGAATRVLRDDGCCARTLHPGLPVELHRDEAEGYHLNLTSGAPVWFVMWRAEGGQAWPELVTLSYNEAGRWLDAQERVDNVPLPAEVAAWLTAYTASHYRPEAKERRRPVSFRPPEAR